jgi:hypothetical protein
MEKSYNDKFKFVRIPAEIVVVVPPNVTVVLPRTANKAQSPRIMLLIHLELESPAEPTMMMMMFT